MILFIITFPFYLFLLIREGGGIVNPGNAEGGGVVQLHVNKPPTTLDQQLNETVMEINVYHT